MARPPVSAKTVSQPDHSSRGDGQREPGFGAHHPRPRPPHRRGETRTRVTRVVRAGRSSSIWDISIYFASQNALCVTPRANAAIDARFMNGDRQVRPKPTLLGKPGRSECMVRPLAGLSPRGVAHDRGHHEQKPLSSLPSKKTVHLSFRTDGVRTSQKCVCIYTAVYSQTLTARSIYK